ncbi:MAG TPA: diguanylate cyclase, partial [Burkholderiaceae bacterium]
DSHTQQALGSADRSGSSGALSASRAGFALLLPASQEQANLLCSVKFRGPAHITAEVWSAPALKAAQTSYSKTSIMIEASLCMLALSMALTAIINRSALYASFVGLLIVSMRMAALSEGMDFMLFGVPLPPALLTPMRQWTLCLYFVMTLLVFGMLFRKEMEQVGANWLLSVHRASGICMLLLCTFLSYEQMLPVLWVSTCVVLAATLPYMYLMLARVRSRPAVWYTLSILVAQAATLGEVIAAALGHRGLLGSLNSVTAALASGLLTSAAVAEHMRADRREREMAQRTLKAAYDDSPVGLFTVHGGAEIVSSNPAFKAMLEPAWIGSHPLVVDLFDGEVSLAFAALHGTGQPASIDLQARLRGSGAERWFAIKASTLDGSIVEGSMQDITERVHATARLEFLVNHDPLTECLNLRGLSRTCERAGVPPRTLAYFDLDRFKLINDLYGHAAGDAVLKQACERIRSQLGEGDLLARVGGDEFVVAFPSAGIAEASRRCHNICALISSAPFQIEAQRFALSVSGGLVSAEGFGGAALKEIISAADTLCRVAKKRPNESLVVMGGGDTFFKHHKAELELISCLEQGKTPEGLFLLMQPELSLNRPFESLNFEVLLRLRKPNGEIVPAPVIIEAAEAHAKTAIIDRWVVSAVI